MRSSLRRLPIVNPRPDSPSDLFPIPPTSEGFSPLILRENPNISNIVGMQSSPTPLNPQNHQTDNRNVVYLSTNEHFNRTSHILYNSSSSDSDQEFPALDLHISLPASLNNDEVTSSQEELQPAGTENWSTTASLNNDKVTSSQAVLQSVRTVCRETIRVFQFPKNERTIHKMPPEATLYEEILVQRGFTVHDEYFVDELMARALRVCKFKAPLAMFSNYEGKSADWFIANDETPLWFFTFVNEDGNVMEYADPSPDRIFFWCKSIELAAWMAGAMAPRNGISVCP